jgi:predicted nucleotidyltransferase
MNFKDYSFASHAEVYTILEKVFAEYGITYYLVGANARDVQLYKAGIKPSRGTADIDFAIMVPDFDVYDEIFDKLCSLGFKKANERYRLYFEKSNTAIDLMPYGKIEQNYTVTFLERDTTLSVLGFTEVGHSAEIFQGEGYSIPVTPVEGILILKLVSWSDKPEWRSKDIEDISFLLRHAWEIYEEEAYRNHLDLFDDSFEQMLVAARIIGRKMGPILAQNETLQERIVSLLENIVKEKDKAQQPELSVAAHLDKSVEEVQEIIRSILSGINDKYHEH